MKCSSKGTQALSFLALVACLLALTGQVLAHRGEVHQEESTAEDVSQEQIEAFDEINESYVKSVKTIFQKSCNDCHSSSTNYPWYSRLPGVKQLIQSDISEAKEHLVLSDDFPFEGHGTAEEDLEAIRSSIVEGTMPPLRYKLLHWDSGLSEKEREAVFTWIEDSLARLQ